MSCGSTRSKVVSDAEVQHVRTLPARLSAAAWAAAMMAALTAVAPGLAAGRPPGGVGPSCCTGGPGCTYLREYTTNVTLQGMRGFADHVRKHDAAPRLTVSSGLPVPSLSMARHAGPVCSRLSGFW